MARRAAVTLDSDSLLGQLETGARALGLELPSERLSLAVSYFRLLERWNRAYNLTRLSRPREMVTRHGLDSWTVLEYLRGCHVVDLGTGAGVPGILLACARPELSVTLVDANAKKVRFCRHACLELGLDNVSVVRGRAPVLPSVPPADTIVARAVADLSVLMSWSRPLGARGSRLIAMKGRRPVRELEELRGMGQNARVHRVRVPGTDLDRHLVLIDLNAEPPASPGTS